MQPVHLEAQPAAVTIDDATKVLLEEARAAAQRGETVTLEQSTLNLRKRLQAWRTAKTEVALSA